LVALINWSQALAGHLKIARDLLEDRDPNSTVDVIVQSDDVPTESHHQKIRDQGGSHKAGLAVVKGGLYSVPAAAIQQPASRQPPSGVYLG